MNKRIVNIGLQISLWAFFLMLPIFLFPELQARLSYDSCHFHNYLALSALLVVYFYFNYYFATPTYFFKKRYWAFIGAHIGFTIGVYLTFILFLIVFTIPCTPVVVTGDSPFSALNKGILPRHIFVFLCSFLMCMNERLNAIDTEKTKADLQLLRTQINPHFLFNVLNTIYGQAIIKSEHTADSIAKLSDLMRYSLIEANGSKVNLDKEMAYLENYITLQKLRLTEKTKVDFQIKGDTKNLMIPPMLFIPFIENAFKYGVSNEVPTTIKILVEVVNKQISLLVENSKVPNKSKVAESHQIGIKNVKNRLDLIYDDQYTLNIKETATHYNVQLLISL